MAGQAEHEGSSGHGKRGAVTMALTALGIVYGDIGTSPLYALTTAQAGGPVTETAVLEFSDLLGADRYRFNQVPTVLSCAPTITVKAHRGPARAAGREPRQGRHVAGLLARVRPHRRCAALWRRVITPAISVMSAVEGLKVDAPQLSHVVVPLTIIILVALFCRPAARHGFHRLDFGPVMLGWFIIIALLGLGGIARAPSVLAALSYPVHAITLISVLGTTGPLRAFWCSGPRSSPSRAAKPCMPDRDISAGIRSVSSLVSQSSPALALNYFSATRGRFCCPIPPRSRTRSICWLRDGCGLPLVAFATLATIIASQAIISGSFSLTQQAVQLGISPRMRVLHTASHEKGQIYIPQSSIGPSQLAPLAR